MESLFLFLKSVLTVMIPLFFAASGGLFTAVAGTLNIALEGLLLAGAFSSMAVFYFTGNFPVSVLSAVICSLSLAAVHAFSVFRLRADLFISGLAVNLLSGGVCAVLSEKLFFTKGVVSINGLINTQGLLTAYAVSGVIVLLLIWLSIYKTPFGYYLRACEKNCETLVSLGINPDFYKAAALLISGGLCGIGGSFLSLNLGAYVPEMSSGRGWIALAVIFLGLKKPLGIPAAAFVFAVFECYSNYAQGFWSIPADFILAFPYICSLAAMIIVSVIPEKSGL